MKQRRPLQIIWKLLTITEFTIAVIISVAVALYLSKVVLFLWDSVHGVMVNNFLETIIAQAFSIVIGVEFIKMICKPTTNTVVEVLIFAIARTMILDHGTTTNQLLCVLSISILCATKKYLSIDFDDEKM